MIHQLETPIATNDTASNDSKYIDLGTIHSITTDDGKIWGAFNSRSASYEWAKFYATHKNNIFTVRDYYEGTVRGDTVCMLSADAIEFGMHPFTEIYDCGIRTDNGSVILDLANGTSLADANTAIWVEAPIISQRQRVITSKRLPPQTADIEFGVEHTIPALNGGEIVIFRRDHEYLVGWRRDARHSRDIRVFSVHDLLEGAAIKAKRYARDFDSPEKIKSKKIRDYQRDKVYGWEGKLQTSNTWLKTIAECKDYADEICLDLGLPPIDVSRGKSTLETHSYYHAARGIVLASHMMCTSTIVHEIAHYFVRQDRSTKEASHGPAFVGVLAALYSKYLDADLDHAFEMAELVGVDFDEPRGRRLLETLEEKSGLKP